MAIHHTKKKKALELIAKGEDAVSYMKQEGFSDEEITEVLNTASQGANLSGNGSNSKSKGYEEWRVEIKLDPDGSDASGKPKYKRRYEKLKRLRECVKISEQEAKTLNDGALNSPRTDYAVMYFLPGEGE